MPTYTYIERYNDTASTYRDEHGDEHIIGDTLLQGGPLRLLVDFDTALNMANEARLDRDALTALLIDPDEADEAVCCEHCPTWVHEDDSVEVGADRLCETCSDSLGRDCYRCGDRAYPNSMYVVEEDWCCFSCYENHTNYCEGCEETYWEDSSRHDDCRRYNCGCETADGIRYIPLSPALVSAGSDTGDTGRLNEDVRHTVKMEGALSDSAAYSVRCEVAEFWRASQNQDVWAEWVKALTDTDPRWKVDGRTYPKRVRKAVFKATGVNLPDALVEKIGNIARVDTEEVELDIALTWDLNMDPEEYANSGSCWWTDYAYSRCTLKEAGGFALRSFSRSHGQNYVSGRSWVIPLRMFDGKLEPTINDNVGEAQAYVVFNSYGDLGESVGARVMANLTGKAYKRIQSGDWSMYVNNSSCYLIAAQNVLDSDPTMPVLSNRC